MADFTITYTLTPEQYASGATKAGLSLKKEGRNKSLKVGITEIVISLVGLFFVKTSPPLFSFLIGICFIMGVYSLSFYRFIFPSFLRKKTYESFMKSPSKDNPITLTLEPSQVNCTVADKNTLVDYKKITAIISPEEVVLTSISWSCVVPRSSASDRFDEFVEELSAMPLSSIIKL